MSDYTVAEVQASINQVEDNNDSESWWEDLDDAQARAKNTGHPITLSLRGEDVPVEAIVVCEVDGEEIFSVVKIGDQLFRQEGYYASHYGTDWDGRLEEVEAYQESVTFYRKR